MKKTLFLFAMVVFFGIHIGFAQELANGFSTGGAMILETNNTGGAMELGLPLLDIDGLQIRNSILLAGFGYDYGGIFALGNKLEIGGFTEKQMRTYTFFQGHAGIYQDEIKDFLEGPFYFDAAGGGGIDIYTKHNMSFFVEIGGGVSLYGDFLTGSAHMATGFRTFWN